MFCIHCGADYPANATFCPNCGKRAKITNHHEAASPATHSPETSRTDISTSTTWIRRVAIPLATLAWIGLVAVILWAASYVARSLLLLAIAAVLAFALAPVVKLLRRFLPRSVAILVTYLIVFSAISVVIYFLIKAAVTEASGLKGEVAGLLHPNAGNPSNPLEMTLRSLGIDQAQIQAARQVLVSHLGGLISNALPLLRGIFEFVLDVIVVAMLSIYFLLDGPRVMRWLREHLPLQQQRRGLFFLETLERVVGGYIRGQLTLSALIGLLVGVGMAVFRVPHPILLGELAFLLAFIPLLGTFISAAACMLLALSQTQGWVISLTHQSWVLAAIVLVYFVAVHAIESHIVRPRIIGHAVGLHPIIALTALVAGAELFGILGVLFAAPVVGFLQAVIVSLWREWQATHPDQLYTSESTQC